jgi:hypothetical protein
MEVNAIMVVQPRGVISKALGPTMTVATVRMGLTLQHIFETPVELFKGSMRGLCVRRAHRVMSNVERRDVAKACRHATSAVRLHLACMSSNFSAVPRDEQATRGQMHHGRMSYIQRSKIHIGGKSP